MIREITDMVNLQLLKRLNEGRGVQINISELASLLGKHRSTIKSKLDLLFDYEIIDRPFHPSSWLLKEYPLIVLERASFQRDSKTTIWIEMDPHIWAAFFVKDEEYNTFLIELHKDLYSYQTWTEHIVDEKKISIPKNQEYIPSDAVYLCAQSIIKYSPSTPISLFKDNFEKGYHSQIKGLELDEVYLQILDALMKGKGLATNLGSLASEMNLHRRTIQKRISHFLDSGLISEPLCQFPRIWSPPEYFLVVSFIEIRMNKHRIHSMLRSDNHVTMAVKANAGPYNLVVFSTFFKMDNHLAWQENLETRFQGSIGAIKNLYLSPSMTFSIQQQFVSLTYLEKQLSRIRGSELKRQVGR